jgi:hypothetical protein
MNSIKNIFASSKFAFVPLSALLLTLTGCVGYVRGPRVGIAVEPAVFVAQDDYVYYPGYDVYYSTYRHQYAYMDGGVWISRPAPRGVSVSVLLASPSVRMDFHDSPANHHAEMVRRYPRNWAPSRSKQVQKEGQREEKRGER